MTTSSRRGRSSRVRCELSGAQAPICVSGGLTSRGDWLLVGHVDLQHVIYSLPDGRGLLDDVSFRVGDGARAALVGANGAGKTTLLSIVSGDRQPDTGSVVRSGGLGGRRLCLGSLPDGSTVHALLVSGAPPGVRAAADKVDRAELALMETDAEP